MRLQQLFELRARYVSDEDKNNREVILIDDSYWVFYRFAELPDEVVEEIKNAIANVDQEFEYAPEQPIDEQDIEEISEGNPRVIVGRIYDDELYIQSRHTAGHDPVTSTQLKKLVNTLGLYGVTWTTYSYEGEETENTLSRHDMKGDLPSTLFHGTSSKNLDGILRTGLKPGQESNWKDANIEHSDYVFGVTTIDGAIFHADRLSGHEYLEDSPVVIEFKVPDKSKLVPDYDVATELYKDDDIYDDLGYSGTGGVKSSYNTMKNRERHWKHTGIFGYKGRIPPSYILTVYANPSGAFIENNDFEFVGTPHEYLEARDREFMDEYEYEEYRREMEEED